MSVKKLNQGELPGRKLSIAKIWSFHCGTAETNLARNHEVVGCIPGLTQGVQDPT